MVCIPLEDVAGDINNKSSKLAEKEFKEKYSWTPTPAIENKIKKILFGN